MAANKTNEGLSFQPGEPSVYIPVSLLHYHRLYLEQCFSIAGLQDLKTNIYLQWKHWTFILQDTQVNNFHHLLSWRDFYFFGWGAGGEGVSLGSQRHDAGKRKPLSPETPPVEKHWFRRTVHRGRGPQGGGEKSQMEAVHIKRAKEQIKNGESQQKLEPPDRDTQPGISGGVWRRRGFNGNGDGSLAASEGDLRLHLSKLTTH